MALMNSTSLVLFLTLTCASCGGPGATQAPARAGAPFELPKPAKAPHAVPRPLPPLRLETINEYRLPPPAVVKLLEAPDPPEPVVHASSGQVALVYQQELMPLQRLARPFLGLAGFRFDPLTNTSRADRLIERIEIVALDGKAPATPVAWQPAAGTLFETPSFSPDGKHLVASVVPEGPARLGLFDVATGRALTLDTPVNTAWGAPCTWVTSDELLCRVLPEGRGEPPHRELGPTVLEHPGGAAPARTYSNLLKDAEDELLFDYYFTSELARVHLDGSFERAKGTSGLLRDFSASPDGRYAVLTRLKRPYSRLVRAERFPRDVEIWDLSEGKLLRKLELPFEGAQPSRGFPLGPREFAWQPGEKQTLGWIERIPTDKKHFVDRWMVLDPPFAGAARQLVRSGAAIAKFGWTTAGTPYYFTTTHRGMRVQVYLIRDGQPALVWQGGTDDVAAQPGRALRTRGEEGAIIEIDGRVFLTSDGYSAHGLQPFLESLDLGSLKTERLHTSKVGELERALALLGGDPSKIVTWHESPTDPPSLRLVERGRVTTLWQLPNPYPALANAKRRLLHYQRADGVKLSGTLYLPPGYNGEGRLPTLLWIYPAEFSKQRYAELPDEKSFHFGRVKGPSPLSVLLMGYAVLYNPTMPIIGDKRSVNDEYLSQLVADAEAAVKAITDMGIADPNRMAVAGRSYGAFSTANLLVHTHLFQSGIAISGAYNRTLTPFGFQSEQRSFWRAPEMYANISPFFHADSIEAPILLIHGGADENAGTNPEQSERFFHALVGNGAPVRYVRLPYEGHQYWARESVMHMVAEMIDWLNRTL